MRRAKLYDLSRHNHLSTIAALQEAISKCRKSVDGAIIILASDNGRKIEETILCGSLTSDEKAYFQASRVKKKIIG